MVSDRAGDIVKTGLPQYGIIEQTLDENYFRIAPDLLPAIQAALSTRQKPVRQCRSREAAPIEIAFQRKDDAMGEGVVASRSHQTGLTQSHPRVAQLHQPTSQTTARGVTD